VLLEAGLDAVNEGIALLPAQGLGEVLRHLEVGVHRRERRPVPLEPAAQHQPLGTDRRQAHSLDSKRRSAPARRRTLLAPMRSPSGCPRGRRCSPSAHPRTGPGFRIAEAGPGEPRGAKDARGMGAVHLAQLIAAGPLAVSRPRMTAASSASWRRHERAARASRACSLARRPVVTRPPLPSRWLAHQHRSSSRTPLNNPQALAGAFAGIVFDHLG
jgi:hypothetical protein